MHQDLRDFLERYIGTVVMALVPVVLVAFVSLPLNLQRHPGEGAPDGTSAPLHMT